MGERRSSPLTARRSTQRNLLTSIDTLAADLAAEAAYMARFYAGQATAKVVPFPVRPTAAPPAFVPVRRAA